MPAVAKRGSALTLITLLCFSLPVLAEKPSWAGKDKGGNHGQKHEKGNGGHEAGHGSTNVNVDIHIGEQQRVIIHDYYSEQLRSGHCPPGLAKKHNGCMPPSQAKKWKIGYPLPRDVIYYNLPPRVLLELGPPPAGHKFVRVAADILLIAVGTGMVIDAIDDLSNIK